MIEAIDQPSAHKVLLSGILSAIKTLKMLMKYFHCLKKQFYEKAYFLKEKKIEKKIEKNLHFSNSCNKSLSPRDAEGEVLSFKQF